MSPAGESNGIMKQFDLPKMEIPGTSRYKIIAHNESVLFDQYRELSRIIHDALVSMDAQGKITDVNAAFVRMVGSSPEALIGTRLVDHVAEPARAITMCNRIMEDGSVSNLPLSLKAPEGKFVEILCNGISRKDGLGFLIVGRDVTDQKRFENELIIAKRNAEAAIQKAEQSSQLKESFLANMSHEIRTPLNAIIGFSDILSRKKLGKKEQEHVKTIKSAGENLLTIINDILDISKIEAGMMIFEEKVFRVKDIFQTIREMLIRKAREKKLSLIFSIDKNVPDTLLGDPTRLTQILLNLAGNAIKFTSKGKVHVICKVIEEETGLAKIEFLVKDTGIGIPEDKLHFVFERFRQAESHTTRKYGGSGLGLSIAKQLVELQGGTLSVKSKFKVGSVFSFVIPYKTTKEMQRSASQQQRRYDLRKLGKLKILLVEDNRLNVLLVMSLFSENKLKLQVAENGSVCVEKLKEGKYDIVLMDMEMPVMNGYEATTVIRKELNNNIPIIAMTAHAMAGEREKCLSLGMNDYISKPIDAEVLFEKMYELTYPSR